MQASSSHKAGKTRDFRQPSQALKEGKTLEMLTAKNHSGGGYRTDDGYVFSPGDVISDTGDGFIVPMVDITIIFQRVPYLLAS